MLEIGCGIGRMTEHLADLFGEVHGTDVSGEMIARGKRRLAHRDNVFLQETGGSDLAPFEDAFFDFAFSFIVFQHVPDKQVVLDNFREVHRVLKPGGIFKFQVQGVALERSEADADTWVGVSFSERELAEAAGAIGFEVRGCEGEGTQYLWSWWRRA
jgi:ubiquinone/menaquinone biosynthesis C-methylase UbiE